MKHEFTLKDSADPNLSIKGVLDDEAGTISFEGYGDCVSAEGHGAPILLDFYEGNVRVIVWAEINQGDPTDIIDLRRARESNRIPE